jgi:hypothetical protein
MLGNQSFSPFTQAQIYDDTVLFTLSKVATIIIRGLFDDVTLFCLEKRTSAVEKLKVSL